MRLRVVRISFVVSLIIFIITIGLLWNMGLYVDEANTSPSIVYGGVFWLNMSWLRLFFSFILTVVLGALAFIEKENE